jgi:hypothetical protein
VRIVAALGQVVESVDFRSILPNPDVPCNPFRGRFQHRIEQPLKKILALSLRSTIEPGLAKTGLNCA